MTKANEIKTPRHWWRERLRSIARRLMGAFLLKESQIYALLPPPAGRIYLRLQLLDLIGFSGRPRRKLPAGARSFLFVCHGNIMRSPMATALLQQAFDERRHSEGWTTRSAGLHAVPGREAHPWAQKAAKKFGISLDGHRVTPITREMVHRADVIFVMDFQNQAELLARYPEVGSKVFLLSAYAHPPQRFREIPDPYYGDENATCLCYAVLQTCIRNLMNELFSYTDRREQSDSVLT